MDWAKGQCKQWVREMILDLQKAGDYSPILQVEQRQKPTVAVDQELKHLNCGTMEINYTVGT